MKANEIAQHGIDYARYLNTVTDRQRVGCTHKDASKVFIEIYRERTPGGSGVYSFYLPGDDVFYIGRAVEFSRIWDHSYAAAHLEDRTLGFPKCRFCEDKRLPESAREKIRRGQFCIDYLVVDPSELAPVFEVHLQAACFLRDGRLPICNAVFG